MARTFPTSSDYLTLGNPTVLAGVMPMTVAAWVNPGSVAAGVRRIITYSDNLANTGWTFGTTAANIRFTKLNAADIDSSTITVTTGVWQFLVASISSTQVRFVRLTPNADMVAQNVSNASSFVGGANVGEIGRKTTANESWVGDIGEIAVWKNVALSDAEILLAMNGALGVRRSDLAGYWLLRGYSPERDLVSGYNGTAVGSTKVVPFPLEQNNVIITYGASEAPSVFTLYDSATVLVDIQVTSVELSDSVDSSTVLVDIQTSGVDGKVLTDLATVLVDVQITSCEWYVIIPPSEYIFSASTKWSQQANTKWRGSAQTKWQWQVEAVAYITEEICM